MERKQYGIFVLRSGQLQANTLYSNIPGSLVGSPKAVVTAESVRENAQVLERAVDFSGALERVSAGIEMLPGNCLATAVLPDENQMVARESWYSG